MVGLNNILYKHYRKKKLFCNVSEEYVILRPQVFDWQIGIFRTGYLFFMCHTVSFLKFSYYIPLNKLLTFNTQYYDTFMHCYY